MTDTVDRMLDAEADVEWLLVERDRLLDENEKLRAERIELRQLLVGLGAGIPAAAILRAEDRR